MWLAARRVKGERRPRELIVSVPLTQAGAVYLDEQSKVAALLGVVIYAALEAERRGQETYPTPAQLLDRRGRARLGSNVVALASPADTPATGRVGYYSDGRQHVAVVVVSASGRMLFIEYEGDVLRTNVAGFVYGDLD